MARTSRVCVLRRRRSRSSLWYRCASASASCQTCHLQTSTRLSSSTRPASCSTPPRCGKRTLFFPPLSYGKSHHLLRQAQDKREEIEQRCLFLLLQGVPAYQKVMPSGWFGPQVANKSATVFLRQFIRKPEQHLPSQARDNHRENSKKRDPFSRSTPSVPGAYPEGVIPGQEGVQVWDLPGIGAETPALCNRVCITKRSFNLPRQARDTRK